MESLLLTFAVLVFGAWLYNKGRDFSKAVSTVLSACIIFYSSESIVFLVLPIFILVSIFSVIYDRKDLVMYGVIIVVASIIRLA